MSESVVETLPEVNMPESVIEELEEVRKNPAERHDPDVVGQRPEYCTVYYTVYCTVYCTAYCTV